MKLTTEEAAKYLSKYVGNEYYTPQCQEAHRMAWKCSHIVIRVNVNDREVQ